MNDPPVAGLAALRSRRREIEEVAARRGASNLRVFGSILRGDASPDSDLDLLVDMPPHVSLIDIIGLQQDLGALIGRRVGVVTEEGLHPRLRAEVLRTARSL